MGFKSKINLSFRGDKVTKLQGYKVTRLQSYNWYVKRVLNYRVFSLREMIYYIFQNCRYKIATEKLFGLKPISVQLFSPSPKGDGNIK